MAILTRSKFNVRTDKAGIAARTVDNIRFDSLKEAKRYQELKLLAKAKVIESLALQTEWDLFVGDFLICRYRCDFDYWENGKRIIEDVKGVKTAVYRIKKRLMLAIYGIEIKEV